MGSSLGAFITLTLSGIPRIVVNPCWYPGEELPLIDVPHEIVRTYAPYDHWVQEHITKEDRPMVHAFFGDRDELFGEKYIAHFLRHYPQEQCHRIPSGHHLSEEAAQKIITLGMSVRQAEGLCKNMAKEPEPKKKEETLKVDYVAECEKQLSKHLGRGVKIVTGKKKGRFELEFYDQDDLQNLLDALMKLK